MMNNDMLEDFYVEADELYAEAEEALLDLEKSQDFQKNFNSIFRAFHSVKGAAGMFGLHKLQEHMHFLENLLEKKKHDKKFSTDMIDYLLLGTDAAKKIITGQTIEFQFYDPDERSTKQKSVNSNDSGIIEKSLKGAIEKSVEKRKLYKGLGGCVFVIDDQDEILQATKDLLESEGFQIHIFLSAKEAMNALKEQTPDVIVTDLNMPEMTGVEFMQKVQPMFPHLPIILVSGYLTKELCLEAIATGVAGVLERPYDINSFLNVLNIAIERYRAFKLLNKSLDLVVYQFENLDKYLAENAKDSDRQILRTELKNILQQKKNLIDRVR